MQHLKKLSKEKDIRLDWKSLHSIYNGLVGKCLIFIALSTPVAMLVKTFNILPWSFVISLIGAIVILVGFSLCLVFTPNLIKKFSDGHEYAEHLIKIEENVDINIEFSILDNIENPSTIVINDCSLMNYTFISTTKTKEVNNNKKTLRILSIIKYSYLLNKDGSLRAALTAMLIIGAFFIFFPTIKNIYIILMSATNV